MGSSMRRCCRLYLKLLVVFFVAMLLVPLPSISQDLQLIRPGPQGRPLMLQDEGNIWAVPISVYSDGDIELLVSENLTLAGIYFDGSRFKKDGTYETYIYSFYKTDRDCRQYRIPPGHASDPQWLKACAELRYNRRLILVDTRKKILTIQQILLMESDGYPRPELMSFPKETIPLSPAVNPALFHAVARITAMINQEISRHPEM